MKLKKTVVSLAGLALLSVGALALLSNSASAAENNDSTTVTFNVKQATSQVGSKSLADEKVYAKTIGDTNGGGGMPGGPRIWGPGYTWHWWGH